MQTSSHRAPDDVPHVAFVGGGNMAAAILGGLVAAGHPADRLTVIEPHEPRARALRDEFGVRVEAAAGAMLALAQVVIWAVKPHAFSAAAAPCAAYVSQALHLSVMAGIRSDAIARATGSERVVRAMPNTPALIGEGIAGLFARTAVTARDQATIKALLASTGETLFVEHEADLDAVTAISGSGPAYVFFFLEAMALAAADMGLSAEQGRRLAEATFKGATALARASQETPETLRARVTSEGGTTHAAISVLEVAGVKQTIIAAVLAAQMRAHELGDKFTD